MPKKRAARQKSGKWVRRAYIKLRKARQRAYKASQGVIFFLVLWSRHLLEGALNRLICGVRIARIARTARASGLPGSPGRQDARIARSPGRQDRQDARSLGRQA